MPKTSARTMAASIGVDIKVFRTALSKQKFPWHDPEAGWSVEVDSPEHKQMIAVLKEVFAAEQAAKKKAPAKAKATAAPKKAAKPKTV